MTDQIPSDLLKLKIRLDAWRKKRKYLRQPLPDELRRAALELCRRYPHSLIRRVLKLQPSRLKSPCAFDDPVLRSVEAPAPVIRAPSVKRRSLEFRECASQPKAHEQTSSSIYIWPASQTSAPSSIGHRQVAKSRIDLVDAPLRV